MSGTRGKPVVLVPGACLGGWCWHDVAAQLRMAGHDVYPLTLTGLGERVHLARPDVDLDTHIEDVVSVLDYEDLHGVVLVGHSYAGIVVTGAVDRRPERIGAVVYLDTSPLPAGMTIVDVESPEQRERQRDAVDRDGDGWRWPVPDGDTLRSGAFGSAGGLTDEDLQRLLARATPQPYATFTTPLRLEREEPPGVRRVAIFCNDGGISLAAVRELLAQQDPRAAVFAGPEWELHELPTGHWSMFSAPDALAELLHRIAAP
ncbi:MAG TPA: alpha/beta hydrolase [Solirubrobacteraceae bacterium]|nr:alpha/beta hydrolase [Solirubrobacteraceae bacterium]